MKVINRIFKTITIPLKFISKVGSSPIKFAFNKRKKLVKIISVFNVKIVAVKISRAGKKIIVTTVFLVPIICSSRIESQKIFDSSCIFPAKMSIERVIEVPNGGAINRPWSPGAKYEGNSSKASSGKDLNLRGRRLLSVSGSDSRSNSGKQLPNLGYKSVPSVNDNRPKSGKSIRITSIAEVDENGKEKITYYDNDGQIINQPSEFLDDVDSVSDGSQNPNDKQIQSETKSQTKDVQNQNSGLTKVRNNITPVQDDRLTPEGDFVNPSQLTSRGRLDIDNTKERRVAPLLQSKYQDNDKKFLPAYSIRQVERKEKHTVEVLKELKKDIEKYNELPEDKRRQIDITIVEELLAHPDTEVYMNVMGQGQEPIAVVLNRGLGTYPLLNHIGTFERRPEIWKYNSYISDYLAKPNQIKKFDASKSSSITYEDLLGNSNTNIGPVFGKIASSTSPPTVNDVNPEL